MPELGLGRFLPAAPDDAAVLAELRAVIDPELGVNIVDLGLVYGSRVESGVARITMTTTTPACPIGSYLEQEIRRALLGLDGVIDVDVVLTHEPPWSPELMSDEAKIELGWLR
jgi:metal-sulfur cluster biosynthetic enzyme